MKCNDCPATLTNATAHIRSISFQRVTLCKPCAVDRGWITGQLAPAPVRMAS